MADNVTLNSSRSNCIFFGRLLIGLLLALGRPFAVFRAVVAIVVNAVNGMLGAWPHPHVGKEVFKRAIPSLAYRNSSTAVMRPPIQQRIGTTLPHLTPRFVLNSLTHPVCFASGAGPFFLQASAACVLTAFNVASNPKSLVSAITKALPNLLFSFVRSAGNYQQSIKSKSNEVYMFHSRSVTLSAIFGKEFSHG